eukprot:TRINITY_DN5623_c1_g1_i1.p1 TRINITY_DN5623_c1_g1~~TRINITY_DN5623_c1_g1_i1.p1  ORF type:complete len:115 (-),score=10.67 TRINITY_DN5623_c1_g1_i1:388-732(-)
MVARQRCRPRFVLLFLGSLLFVTYFSNAHMNSLLQTNIKSEIYNTNLSLQVLHSDPKVYYATKILTSTECTEIIALAEPELRRSNVVGQGGADTQSLVRTSQGMFLITDVQRKP